MALYPEKNRPLFTGGVKQLMAVAGTLWSVRHFIDMQQVDSLKIVIAYIVVGSKRHLIKQIQ